MKKLIFGIMATFFVVLVFAGFVEVYVRLMYTDGTDFDIEMWRYAKDLKQISDIEGAGRIYAFLGPPARAFSLHMPNAPSP